MNYNVQIQRILDKFRREQREAAADAAKQFREAAAKNQQDRIRAADKARQELIRAIDRARQELLAAQNRAGKEGAEARLEALLEQLRSIEEALAELSSHSAVKQAAERAKNALDKEKRGLVMVDVENFAAALAEAEGIFAAAVAETASLLQPAFPSLLYPGDHGAVYRAPTRYKRWSGGWMPWPEPLELEPDDVVTDMENSFHRLMTDLEITQLYAAWHPGFINPIQWSTDRIRDCVGHLRHVEDRTVWRPGRCDFERFREALADIHPEASEAWNATVESIPVLPHNSIENDLYDHIVVDGQGADLFRPTYHGAGLPEGQDGHGYAITLWQQRLEAIDAAYASLQLAKSLVIRSPPGVSRARDAVKLFRKGSQFKFRGL